MLSSVADVSRILPARRAFTVATGPLAHTPPAPSSSFVFSLPTPVTPVSHHLLRRMLAPPPWFHSSKTPLALAKNKSKLQSRETSWSR
eukprot:1962928-Pleurochrysis_carterae.AAC.1